MAEKIKPVLVTKRSLFQRVGRKIRPELLLAARSDRQEGEMGSYYTVNPDTGKVTATHLDLENLAIKLGCIKPWEELER